MHTVWFTRYLWFSHMFINKKVDPWRDSNPLPKTVTFPTRLHFPRYCWSLFTRRNIYYVVAFSTTAVTEYATIYMRSWNMWPYINLFLCLDFLNHCMFSFSSMNLVVEENLTVLCGCFFHDRGHGKTDWGWRITNRGPFFRDRGKCNILIKSRLFFKKCRLFKYGLIFLAVDIYLWLTVWGDIHSFTSSWAHNEELLTKSII